MDFAAIFECSPNPYLLMTAELTVVAVNQAYLTAIGRTEQEVLNKPFFSLFPAPLAGIASDQQESIDMLRASLQRVLERKAPDTLAFGTFLFSGTDPSSRRYWSCSHTPILDHDGQVDVILQHTVDVTEAHTLHRTQPAISNQRHPAALQVEQEMLGRVRQVQETNRVLYAERLHLLRLFEEAPGFICFLRGREHCFELANRAWFELIGERDIIGAPLRYGIPELAGQGYFELIDHVFESARPYIGSGMQMFVARDSSDGLVQVYLDLVLQPIVENDGSVSGILLQGNDVTDQLHAQLELRRYREQLEELVEERTEALLASEAERRKAEQALLQSQKLESLGKLTGVVAHDFNNVLQIISGNMQLLLRQQRDYPQLQDRTRAALEGVGKGAHLAAQLLAFSRRQSLAPQVVDMEPLLQQLRALLSQAVGRGIEVELQLGDTDSRALIDPHQFESMLVNLVINARDAIRDNKLRTDPAPARGHVVVRTRRRHLPESAAIRAGEYLSIEVEDNGCGMAEAVRTRAFEPFYSNKSSGGTGLGLSTAYGFVGQSGGHLELQSTEGVGTTITILLPLAAQPATWPPPETALTRPIPEGSETVLLVESDTAVREVTADLLDDLGYQVTACADFDSAETHLRAAAFDVVIAEFVAPGAQRPADLAAAARRRKPDTAVLFISGQLVAATQQHDVANALVLKKPFDRAELAEQVREALQLTQPKAANHGTTADRSRVLLVEDDRNLRQLATECLSQLGCEVTACSSGEEARRRAEDTAFDILFTDVNLVDVSGLDLARELLGRNPALRVVLASGDARIRGDELPRAVFLPKPYDLKSLQDVVASQPA